LSSFENRIQPCILCASVSNLLEDGSATARGLSFFALSRGFDNRTAIFTAAAGKRTTDAATIAARQTTPVRNFFIFHPPMVPFPEKPRLRAGVLPVSF
jgi:hypothetical protein